MLPAAPADDGAVLFVRHRRHGAGVDNIAVAVIFKGTDFVPLLAQQPLHGLGFILIGFAAEGIKSYLHLLKPPIKKSNYEQNRLLKQVDKKPSTGIMIA